MAAAQVGLTTSIFYNCAGVDADSGYRFHCWITDRTIPLDEFCRYEDAIKSKCSHAAFCCLLRATLHGLYLADCQFYNFGVQLTESATEHRVVIIHAGRSGIHQGEPWKKSQLNVKVMHRFWKACTIESATNLEIQDMWRNPSNSIEACLKTASEAWQARPFLSKSHASTGAIWQARDSAARPAIPQMAPVPGYSAADVCQPMSAKRQRSQGCNTSNMEVKTLGTLDRHIIDDIVHCATSSWASEYRGADSMWYGFTACNKAFNNAWRIRQAQQLSASRTFLRQTLHWMRQQPHTFDGREMELGIIETLECL
jgi:hypothetical protein